MAWGIGCVLAFRGAGLRLKADQAVVDGEIVALDAQGSPSFQALQHRASHPGHQIAFYALALEGFLHLAVVGQPFFCTDRTPGTTHPSYREQRCWRSR